MKRFKVLNCFKSYTPKSNSKKLNPVLRSESNRIHQSKWVARLDSVTKDHSTSHVLYWMCYGKSKTIAASHEVVLENTHQWLKQGFELRKVIDLIIIMK